MRLPRGAGVLVAAGMLSAPAAASAQRSAASQSSLLIEEVAAIVEKRPILLSELELEARLERVRKEGRSARFADPVGQPELRRALDRLVQHLLVFLEAERLQLFAPATADVTEALAAFEGRFGGGLARAVIEAGLDPASLVDSVRREVRVRRYLDGRFRLAARPRDSDLRRYWNDHPELWQGRTLVEAA